MGIDLNPLHAAKKLWNTASGQTTYNPNTPDELQDNATRTGGEANQQQARGQTQQTTQGFQNFQANQQQPFLSTLYARATGTGGPSPAERESQNRLNQLRRSAVSVARMNRGSHRGAGISQAIDQGYRAFGANEETAQATRAAERLASERAYADELGRIQGQNLALAGVQQAQQGIDLNQAGLGQADQMALLQSAIEEERMRSGLKQSNAANSGALFREGAKTAGAVALGGL